MALYLIGIGLGNEKDITLNGMEAVKKCSRIYLENYTSTLTGCKTADLEKLYSKKIIPANRELVEKKAESTILADALKHDTALLIAGDVFGATTHADLFLRAKEKNIEVRIINNASIINAVGNTGLELYKFGRTTSVVFGEENWKPETAYDAIKENKKISLHTLCLLDIKINENNKNSNETDKFMTVSQAIKCLLDIEARRKENVFTEDTFAVGCARLSGEDPVIRSGRAKDLIGMDFGKPLHCLIVPGRLHFKEEEMLEFWNNN